MAGASRKKQVLQSHIGSLAAGIVPISSQRLLALAAKRRGWSGMVAVMLSLDPVLNTQARNAPKLSRIVGHKPNIQAKRVSGD